MYSPFITLFPGHSYNLPRLDKMEPENRENPAQLPHLLHLRRGDLPQIGVELRRHQGVEARLVVGTEFDRKGYKAVGAEGGYMVNLYI